MSDPDHPYRLDIEVNEAKGTVTPSRPDTGAGSEMRAVFMPDTVRFGPFMIDRTTLRIHRSTGTASHEAVIDGQCSLIRRMRRAF